MKIKPINLIASCCILCAACNPFKIEIPDWGDYEHLDGLNVPSEVVYPEAGVLKTTTLLTSDFTKTTLAEGVYHYQYQKKDNISNANQLVNVLEIDLNNPDHYIRIISQSADTTSAIAKSNNALAATNGTYEMPAVYVRINGYNETEVSLDLNNPENASRYWKHNAALVGDGKNKYGIINAARGAESSKEGGDAAIALYKRLPEKFILAGAPILIDDYDPVGERFVPDGFTQAQLNALEYEDYRKHQGVRHPRTAVALTADNDLLLVVADGRTSRAEGFSAKELTKFLKKHFNPRWAVNLDGGGSSTMYIRDYNPTIKDSKGKVHGVVNYPTDDIKDANGKVIDSNKNDHYGQRKVRTHILVMER